MADEASQSDGGNGGPSGSWDKLKAWWRLSWDERALASNDPTRIVGDVLVRPSIGPIAGWIIALLVALVAYLTIEFAPDAAERAKLAHGADPGGVIPPWVGRSTIAVVSIAAIIIGMEPIWRRKFGRYWPKRITPQTRSGPRLLRQSANFVLMLPSRALRGLWRAPSWGLSLIDYILARPIAWLAGAMLKPWPLRYGWLLALIAASVVAATFAPAPHGLWGVLVGVLAILAVVRRWSWIEGDREAFFVAGYSDPDTERIGFAEDLRDEALLALVFLFLLIPLGLRQVDLHWTTAFELNPGSSWLDWAPPLLRDALAPFIAVFTTTDAPSLRSTESLADITHSVWTWMGFFGAELTKSVPFVDWSEVFHVANGSPIKAGDSPGPQLVFALRATLDLLLLAAVLQAVQIAGRLVEQSRAFFEGKLKVLDPFAELEYFSPAGQGWHDEQPLLPTDQPKIAAFPNYQEERLQNIAEGVKQGGPPPTSVLRSPDCRRAAMAVLARQYPNSIKSAASLAGIAAAPRANDERLLAIELMATQYQDEAVNELGRLVSDASLEETYRIAAARELGWMRNSTAATALVSAVNGAGSRADLSLAISVALAKLKHEAAPQHLLPFLSNSGSNDAAEARAMRTAAYALGLVLDEDELSQRVGHASGYAGDVQQIASLARTIDTGVRSIPTGGFWMGSAEGDSDERPRHLVTIGRAFGMHQFAVTVGQWAAFIAATDHKMPLQMYTYEDGRWELRENRDWRNPGFEQSDDHPVVGVSWDDVQAFIAWLNALSDERYRLPSEAEWEYACRGHTDPNVMPRPYWSGETITRQNAQYSEKKRGDAGGTVAVGSLPASENGFGLHDMHGNVWEWCADVWHNDYSGEGRPDDGRAWLTGGDQTRRVRRGGSWSGGPRLLRSAYRSWDDADRRNGLNGFRLARTIPR